MSSIPAIATTKKEGENLLVPLQPLIANLSIVDEESYLEADGLLGRIRTNRAKWKLRISRILDPAKTVYDEARKLRDEVDKPLESMETTVKTTMMDYKRAEARQLNEAREAQEREAHRLQQEIEAKERKEAAARTRPMREKIARTVNELRARQEEVEAIPQPAVAKGVSSSTRTVKRIRLLDIRTVMAGILNGEIPDDVIITSLNTVVLMTYLRANEAAVKSWAGLEVYEDITIVGR